MQLLLRKIHNQAKEKNKENVIRGFEYIISNITDKWILDNFSVSIINSKFNEILKTLRDGKTANSGRGYSYDGQKWADVETLLSKLGI